MIPPPTLESLLGHEAWLRELVGRLVSGADVDDVVQETWLAALARPPQDGSRARHWLARVARNLALRARRGAARRGRREAAGARAESEPSAEDTFARLALQREVTQLVLELAEPYRTTIVWHFHDELSVREIAPRMRTSEANVRQRLARGLAMLRARLAREKGGEWRAALTPLALRGAGEITGAVVIGMQKAVLAVAALLVLAASFAWWVGSDREDASGAHSGSQAPIAVRVDEPGHAAPATSLPVVREPVPAGAVVGQVLDPRGHALADVPIVLDGAHLLARSDAAGRFTIAASEHTGTLCAGEGFATQIASELRGGRVAGGEALVVASRESVLRAVVHDAERRPLEDVVVTPAVVMAAELNHRLARPGVRLLGIAPWTTSDARGEIRGPVPSCALDLTFEKRGYARRRVPLSPAWEVRTEEPFPMLPNALHIGWAPPVWIESDVLHVTLDVAKPVACRISGRVLDGAGAPVAGALVGFQKHLSTTSDADGQFRLELDPNHLPGDAPPLFAAKRGLRPALIPDAVARLHASARGEIEVELVLGSAPLQIVGRVVRADGTPMPGMLVFPWRTEDLGGELGSPEELAMPEDAPVFPLGHFGRRAIARSDAQGRFTLPGLLARDYRLRVTREHSWGVMTTEPIAAGREDVEVILSKRDYNLRVEGVIRTVEGAPVAGAQIVHGVTIDQIAGGGSGLLVELGRTDAAGRFTVKGVSRAGRLELRCEGFCTQMLDCAELDGRALEITLGRRCELVLEGVMSWRGVELRDAMGRTVPFYDVDPTQTCARLEIESGNRTRRAFASETAATLRLVRENGQREDRPIRLVAGVSNLIRL